MILNCPNCSARYVLPDSAIPAEGREVRCAKCTHEWFEGSEAPELEIPPIDAVIEDDSEDNYPAIADSDIPPRFDVDDNNDDDENEEDAIEEQEQPEIVDESKIEAAPKSESESEVEIENEEDVNIPDAVKPKTAENKSSARKKRKRYRQKPSLQALLTGYAAAALIFAALILCCFVFKKEIVTSWPPAAAIYDLAGMPVILKGQDLVIENLSASVLKGDADEDVLVLKGRVINLTNKPMAVPQMMALMRSTNGEDGASWLIDAPVDLVEPGASFIFTSNYPNMPRGVGSVNLTFVPTISG